MINKTSLHTFITFLIVTFFCHEVLAMEPAPFEDVKFTDSESKVSVTSTFNKEKGEYSTDGVTTVYDSKGKTLWHMNAFAGRREIKISPDGKDLIFIGNVYFGGQMQPSPSEEIAVIYEAGKKIKTITLFDFLHEMASEIARSKASMMKGGDWMRRSDLIKDIKVDWAKRKMVFKMYDDKMKEFNF
jgi:hypothetical protein